VIVMMMALIAIMMTTVVVHETVWMICSEMSILGSLQSQ
jgi:hypothetical protein